MPLAPQICAFSIFPCLFNEWTSPKNFGNAEIQTAVLLVQMEVECSTPDQMALLTPT